MAEEPESQPHVSRDVSSIHGWTRGLYLSESKAKSRPEDCVATALTKRPLFNGKAKPHCSSGNSGCRKGNVSMLP